MALATGEHVWSNGETITHTLLNLNTGILKASVNAIAAEQLGNTIITNDHVSSTAGIVLSKLKGYDSNDPTLNLILENYIDGCFINVASGGATIDVSPGSVMINGRLRRITSAIQTNPGTDPTAGDWLDVWVLADASATTFTVSVVDSDTTPGGSSNPGTNGRMIGSVYHIGSGVYGKWINFRRDYICGWGWKVGNDTAQIMESFYYGKTFTHKPLLNCFNIGRDQTGPNVPVDPGSFDSAENTAMVVSSDPTVLSTTLGRVIMSCESTTTFSSSYYFGYGWIAKGAYS